MCNVVSVSLSALTGYHDYDDDDHKERFTLYIHETG